MKNIALLGSTGSIGRSSLKVVRHLKDELRIVALAAKSNLDLLEEQVREFAPKLIAVGDPGRALEFQRRVPHIPVLAGEEGLIAAASFCEADFALMAMSGMAGLKPAAAAIRAGKTIGIANKELLVSAGELIVSLARQHRVKLLPIDSEHSALFQCLEGNDPSAVRRLIITASGGPFRTTPLNRLSTVTVEEALAHPNWRMGAKITIDSSTLMNKGLELIEARWLFDLPPSKIDVVVHPQSIVHSMVEYCDGSILAQMGEHDMVMPIQYALTYPKRRPGMAQPFDFLEHSMLTFEPLDRKKFLCFKLAEEALAAGKSYPCAMNAANEVLVERFLKGSLRWSEIGAKLEKLMSSHAAVDVLTLETVQAIDGQEREKARIC